MLDEKERKEQEEKDRIKREKEARKYCKKIKFNAFDFLIH